MERNYPSFQGQGKNISILIDQLPVEGLKQLAQMI
jgi:hypothetical protein